ncbi:PxKF domain-containing protein [Aquibacillus sp. 3ASR75-11]|uniref:PxKF domain-containing protein n=1 Tax=Terrihalobacillus insolitus TaxID=2950438 RepID=A0A9X3WQ78_9BACI|nr:glycoside hydrolase [Terrihalobacillus insolitus]MDC3412097.1 PxKF domain-containing protein [Terrihalobacillus insolitus]MDC3423210.1 PxKF domain-containing protein [Terrihalobacillus insolitus]
MANASVRKFLSTILIFVLVVSSLPTGEATAQENPISSTIYLDDIRQEIDGFGASGAFQQARNLMNFPEKERSEILDLLFSTTDGAGFSMVRNMVGDGGTWGNEIDGPTPTIWPEEDGGFVWTGDEDQIWLMNQAKEYGVDKFMSTVWSPPAWMKTNNSVTNGGELKEDMYQEYADYLSAYIRGYKEQHGIEIDAISLANEPNLSVGYSSSRWTGDQFKRFIADYLTPTFEEDEITAQVILGENSSFIEEPAIPVLKDPETRDGIDIVAAHAYGGDRGAYNTFPLAKKYDKRIWQTETSNLGKNDPSIDDGVYWAKLIQNQMTNAEVNAWFYWWFVAYKLDKGEPLINLDTQNNEYFVNKRLYTIGNYSRFVRPGFNRVSTSEAGSGVYVSAYKNTDTGEYVIVTVNDNDTASNLNLDFAGFNASYVTDSVTPYRTSETENLAQLTDISVKNGEFKTELPAKSVTTFVGKAQDVSSNVLKPVNQDEVTNVKLGRTLPVKFELTTAGEPITNANAELYVAEVTDGVVGPKVEVTSKGEANEGNIFRYAGNKYNYNFNTKSLSEGTYQLIIDVNGYTVETVEINLE